MKPEDLAAIQRRQRLAEAMLQRSQQDEPTNQMAGGYVVPYSPVQGIAKIANQLAGTWIGNKAGKDYNKALSEINLDDPNAYQSLMAMGMPKEALALKMAQSRQTRPNYYQPTNQIVQDETGQLRLKRYGSDPNQPAIIDDSIMPNNLRWIDKGDEFVPVPTKGTLDGQPPVRQGSPNTFVDISPDASPEDRAMLERIAAEKNVQPSYAGQLGTGLKKSLTPEQELKYSGEVQSALEYAKGKGRNQADKEAIGIKEEERRRVTSAQESAKAEARKQQKTAPADAIKYLSNEFVKKDGILDSVVTGGNLGYKGKIARVTDSQKAATFDNAVQQLSTELRTIFRIPGEGPLSDFEQKQYNLQLPSTDYDRSVNEKILKDLEFRTGLRTGNNGVNKNQTNPTQPPTTPTSGGLTPEEQEELRQLKARFGR